MDIHVATKSEAEEVVTTLKLIKSQYGYASVADLFFLVQKPSTYKDTLAGWTDLSQVSVAEDEALFKITLPDPVYLKLD